MAVKRGKSQARRNNGSSGGLPGWAWLVLGIVLTLAVILVAPRWLKSDGGDGFIRPRPNPDAQPQTSRSDDDSVVPARGADEGAAPPAPKADDRRQYDFYTLLPGQEVAMSDAELAASARAEQDRQRKLAEQQANAAAAKAVQDPTAPAVTTPATAAPAAASTAPAPDAAASPAGADGQARYILQAGAFGGSGDAESLKARIALLGLNARVESAAINGKTVYRVRMGPYGTATELADAKRKLANGGLPAMAVKAR